MTAIGGLPLPRCDAAVRSASVAPPVFGLKISSSSSTCTPSADRRSTKRLRCAGLSGTSLRARRGFSTSLMSRRGSPDASRTRTSEETRLHELHSPHMQRSALLVALVPVLAIAAGAAANPQPVTRVCTIRGPQWTQKIALPKRSRLLLIHGRRYYVFVDHLSCAWAGRVVSRLIPLRKPWKVRDASPPGYACNVGDTTWFRDAFNGDAVRWSQPQTSVGSCVLPQSVGLTYNTFWWTPAKPRR